MIRIPWTCPCGVINTLILNREAMVAELEHHDDEFERCQTCRAICRVKYQLEVFATMEGVEKAE